MISYFEKKNSIPILEVVSAEVAANQKDIETAIGVLVQASLAGFCYLCFIVHKLKY